jgi:uncharacterized protein with von Willebrand factor type A (vWA) domain
VEADVFLVDGALLVGHTHRDLRPERTLEKLYLDPLRRRIEANRGRVYKKGPTFWLMIDVKSEARSTYKAVDRLLRRYADILSSVTGGTFKQGAVTVVISGNRAKEIMAAQKVRYAGLDGRATDLEADDPVHLMPWISDRWTSLFHWRGQGAMPEEERARLAELVARAHRRGRLVRFWATPETPAVWQELRRAGVDLINTDRLEDLQKFLRDPRKE